MADQNDYNRKMIEDFRETRAKTGVPMDGRPLLLLTNSGAKTGRQYVTPLMFIRADEKLLVFASNMGAEKQPDWCVNLKAHPRVTVEVGSETYEADAVVAEGAQREKLWALAVQDRPFLAEHQAKAKREIPLIELRRMHP